MELDAPQLACIQYKQPILLIGKRLHKEPAAGVEPATPRITKQVGAGYFETLSCGGRCSLTTPETTSATVFQPIYLLLAKAFGGTRTLDFRFTKAALYQLSYEGGKYKFSMSEKFPLFLHATGQWPRKSVAKLNLSAGTKTPRFKSMGLRKTTSLPVSLQASRLRTRKLFLIRGLALVVGRNGHSCRSRRQQTAANPFVLAINAPIGQSVDYG